MVPFERSFLAFNKVSVHHAALNWLFSIDTFVYLIPRVISVFRLLLLQFRTLSKPESSDVPRLLMLLLLSCLVQNA